LEELKDNEDLTVISEYDIYGLEDWVGVEDDEYDLDDDFFSFFGEDSDGEDDEYWDEEFDDEFDEDFEDDEEPFGKVSNVIPFNREFLVGRNDPCPCGSGKKYKHCCSISPARLPEKDRILFYDTWLRLLDYVNKKEKVCDYQVNFLNPAFNLQSKLCLIRDRLWEKPSFISEYTLLNPALTKEAAELLRAWEKKHVRGKFLLLEYRNGTAIMMQIKENETPKLYAVIGITSTISETVMSAPPVLLKTVLLPFGDRIIYDGFIVPYQISFGLGARKMFSEQYEMEKLKHGILTKL